MVTDLSEISASAGLYSLLTDFFLILSDDEVLNLGPVAVDPVTSSEVEPYRENFNFGELCIFLYVVLL